MKTVKKTWYIVGESILLDPGNEECKENMVYRRRINPLDPGNEDCKENRIYRGGIIICNSA